ncbi:EF-hand domain-containing protein [Pseudocolwellia sp. HL-MZ19]|uniref:EF-hand domain-containing protein n=1 Tax=Pseudocolwellia sp. HL-MZ19 TaxID=3400846 RepID=UPI003CEB13D6
MKQKKVAHKADKKAKGKKGHKGKNKRNRTIFAALDTDENGQISEQEFNDVRTAKDAKHAKRMEKRPTFSMLDADGDGVITKAESKAFSKQRSEERKLKKQSS